MPHPRRRSLFLSILSLALALGSPPLSTLGAQARTVTGKVTAADGGTVLAGVSVIVRGTNRGAMTDATGSYRVTLPASGSADVLTFRLIGYTPVDIPVAGRTSVDVALETARTTLSSVVVTANAIVRETKELGYSIAQIEPAQLTVARSSNVLNSVAGKVSGVRVTQQSGTVGGSSKVVIRGVNSIASATEPLFVVDGVPISNSSFAGTETEIVTGGVDVGNRAQDLNPDDIESMSILKGAAASALYGSRARNGVIVVTTKRGRAGQRRFTYNGSVRADQIFRSPEFQNEYAQGSLGVYNTANANGWGPKITGQTEPNILGVPEVLRAYPNNFSDFFETGYTNVHAMSFDGGTETSDYRLGGTWLGQTGIIPNSELQRYTLSVNSGQRFTDKLSVRLAANYARSSSAGRASQGQNGQSIPMSLWTFTPRTLSTEFLRANRIGPDGRAGAIDGTGTSNNPYFVVDNNGLNNSVDRVYGNAYISYDASSWLNLAFRAGTDIAVENRRFVTRKGTRGRLDGEFDTQDFNERELNTDFIATVTRQLTPDLAFKGLVGHNFNKRVFKRQRVFSQGLNIDKLYTQANANVNAATNFLSERQLFGAYGDVGLAWRDYLFVNVTGRNDWSSTLPVASNRYFYPSVSTGFVLSDAFKEAAIFKSGKVSFAKLRANWANVGSDEEPYQLAFTYAPLTQQSDIYTFNQSFPYNGASAFAATNVIPPANLKPQRQSSWEVGGEFRVLNDRIGVDLTVYNLRNYDQIVSISVPQSTGFNARRLNVGEIVNNGIEAQVSYSILRAARNGLQWDVTANYSRNKNEITKLAPGLKEFIVTSGDGFGTFIAARPGTTFQIQGVGFLRDSVSGQYVINPQNGLRITGPRRLFGNIYPDWIGGISNSIRYKDAALSFLIDTRRGGVVMSNTVSSLRSSGTAKETADRTPFVQPGVIINADGTRRPNDVKVASVQQYWGNLDSSISPENNIFDGSYTKLRELQVSYTLPRSWASAFRSRDVVVSVEGRNLWLISSKVPHIDPEANVHGTSLIGEGIERNNLPSTRSFGINVRLAY
ncbi:MAG: SusC/RagA family TonB-linked outer membrane protein [Gemmatimonadaceae bacterium]|nr:SusC/RagA family TonB-linked outer membrane protein [Gemmatimonadaceae bacterium]